MAIILQRQEIGREQFKVYDERRYIGRLYQTPIGDWYWCIDLLLMEGKRSIDGRSTTRAEALAQLRAAWQGVKHGGQSAA